MTLNGEHPLKPHGVLCRLDPLKKWSGWTDKQIAEMEAVGLIHPLRIPKNRNGRKVLGRRWYIVAEVEQILGGVIEAK